MQTFECLNASAPVTCDPNTAATALCPYCQSLVAVPDQFQSAQLLEQIEIDVNPQVTAGRMYIIRHERVPVDSHRH